MSCEPKQSTGGGGDNVASRPRTLLSRYLIGDEDDELSAVATTLKKTAIDEDFERQTREELNCIQVISPRVDSMPSLGAGGNALEALRDISGRIAPATTTTATVEDAPAEPTNTSSPAKVNIWSDDTIGTGAPKKSQYRITFEIIKARIVDAAATGSNNFVASRRSSRYVSYTILVKRVPGLDSNPAVIERRYSDFYTFYSAIKRRHPALLKDVPFPRKIFLGNFAPDIISERCQAFKTFLAFCLSVPEIRASREFATFLYHSELREAKRHMTQINLEEAGFVFENIYHLLEKLHTLEGRPNAQLVHTACCLVGCYNAIDNSAEARVYAERTFEMLAESPTLVTPINGETDANGTTSQVINLYESVELVLPLILLSLRLCWFTGARKVALENKVEELCQRRGLPRNFDSQPSLLERLLKKDFQPVLEL